MVKIIGVYKITNISYRQSEAETITEIIKNTNWVFMKMIER